MKRAVAQMLKVILCLWVIGIFACIIFVKNPFFIRRINAEDKNAQDIEEVFSETAPYVKLEHMNLEYTGYYSVYDEKLVSYCFMGTVGEQRFFVEMSAEKVHKLTSDVTDGLKDVSFMGKMSKDEQMLNIIAGHESMSAQSYREKYGISSVSIFQYQNDYERVIIYYMMALFTGGIIFTGTSIGKKQKTKES